MILRVHLKRPTVSDLAFAALLTAIVGGVAFLLFRRNALSMQASFGAIFATVFGSLFAAVGVSPLEQGWRAVALMVIAGAIMFLVFRLINVWL